MSERIKKQKNKKTNQKVGTDFFRKTLVQSLVSLIIGIVVVIAVKAGGRESKVNIFVKKQLNESIDIKKTAVSVYNKVNNIIDDEIIPVINNIGVSDD
ncbi:MAG: hypothetical protein J6A69_08660 [Clostridia bacterium]|nr:hypothetical protein [Clostridia bacterium]